MVEILVNNKKYYFPLANNEDTENILNLANILNNKIKKLKEEINTQTNEDLMCVLAILLLDEIQDIKSMRSLEMKTFLDENDKSVKIISSCIKKLEELNTKI